MAHVLAAQKASHPLSKKGITVGAGVDAYGQVKKKVKFVSAAQRILTQTVSFGI
jgi:hypothetical protein